MYWWNIAALRYDLMANAVSGRDMMKYLLAHFVAVDLIVILAPPNDHTALYATVTAIISLTITVWGILFCYRANRLGDGKHIIERFICISWPITIRIGAYWLLIRLLLSLLYLLVPQEASGFTVNVPEEIRDFLSYAVSIWHFLWVRSELLKMSGAGRVVPATG